MKNLCKFVLVAICLTLAMSVVSCKKDNTEDPGNTPKAKYTIMLYGCGGGDIDMQLEDALEREEPGALHGHVQHVRSQQGFQGHLPR